MTADRFAGAREVVERSPTAQCVVREGTITYANRAMGELFGTDPADLEGTSFAERVAPTDRERVTDALDELRGDAATLRFDVERGTDEFRTVESEWAVDGDDERVLVGTLRDVTDRAERRAELERESEMLESLLDNIPMSIYFKDRLSRHERVSTHMMCRDEESFITNDEGKRHAHRDDVLGKTDFDLYGPGLAEPAVEEDREIMESEEAMFNEVTETTTNLGETFFSSTTKAPRYDESGNVIGIVGVTMDVTDRMSYERELERQKDRLEEFNEVLAHDLRNPLAVARGHVELLEEEYDHFSIGKVDDALGRMSTLIDEIRSFVVQGRTVESPDEVELASVAREAWPSIDTGDATIEVSATHTVRADADRLRRLLENVYRNAVEHGCPESDEPEATDELTVTVGDLEDGFYVADDGPGIPDERKDDVFDRGFSTDTEGTGFGLAIVENIARAHDWSVTVADADGGGAKFEFTDVVRVEPDATEHF